MLIFGTPLAAYWAQAMWLPRQPYPLEPFARAVHLVSTLVLVIPLSFVVDLHLSDAILFSTALVILIGLWRSIQWLWQRL